VPLIAQYRTVLPCACTFTSLCTYTITCTASLLLTAILTAALRVLHTYYDTLAHIDTTDLSDLKFTLPPFETLVTNVTLMINCIAHGITSLVHRIGTVSGVDTDVQRFTVADGATSGNMLNNGHTAIQVYLYRHVYTASVLKQCTHMHAYFRTIYVLECYFQQLCIA
jgi:hypothetical protein